MNMAAADRAIQRAWLGYLRTFLLAPGAEGEDTDQIFWYITEIPGENSVMWADLAPDAVAAQAERLLARFAERGKRLDWLVGPESAPSDLAERLQALGFTTHRPATTMAADLTDPPATAPAVPGLEIRTVTDAALLEEWIAVERDGFGQTPPQAAAYGALRRAVPLGPDRPWQRYVALLNDVPVANTTLFVAGDVCGIFDVCTVPAARRQGVAGALVAHALAEARARGCQIATLQPSDEGIAVYRRLGFVEATPYQVLSKR